MKFWPNVIWCNFVPLKIRMAGKWQVLPGCLQRKNSTKLWISSIVNIPVLQVLWGSFETTSVFIRQKNSLIQRFWVFRKLWRCSECLAKKYLTQNFVLVDFSANLALRDLVKILGSIACASYFWAFDISPKSLSVKSGSRATNSWYSTASELSSAAWLARRPRSKFVCLVVGLFWSKTKCWILGSNRSTCTEVLLLG